MTIKFPTLTPDKYPVQVQPLSYLAILVLHSAWSFCRTKHMSFYVIPIQKRSIFDWWSVDDRWDGSGEDLPLFNCNNPTPQHLALPPLTDHKHMAHVSNKDSHFSFPHLALDQNSSELILARHLRLVMHDCWDLWKRCFIIYEKEIDFSHHAVLSFRSTIVWLHRHISRALSSQSEYVTLTPGAWVLCSFNHCKQLIHPSHQDCHSASMSKLPRTYTDHENHRVKRIRSCPTQQARKVTTVYKDFQ